MTYIEYVIKYLKNQIPGNPIYTADIAKAFSKEYSFEIKKANAAVSVAIKRIIDTKQLENLRFYQKGIYYLAVKTPFGETGINKEILIREKYLIPDIGYETGYTVLHQMGLTTQMPNERVLVTNKARDCIRADKSLDVYIRPPKETVTQTNNIKRCCFYTFPISKPIQLIPNNQIFSIKEYKMDENEKKLLQAKHRLEEAQARDRVKERKARTRRLIQEGAILEKAFPQSASMSFDELESYLFNLSKQT